MDLSHVVVDGSNIATEARSTPSLSQLDEAVRAFQEEFPDLEVIVIVDASFGHRIDPSEVKAFDEAVAHGEIVSPPAGAIGRGDAFLLRIAERVGGQVLSNDSFQEFHGEHPWLFDKDRLIGGKPVPGAGWIFTLRNPVRGVRSRKATGDLEHSPGRAESSPARAQAASSGADRAVMRGGTPPAKAEKATKKAKSAEKATKAEKSTKAEKAEKATKVKATKADKSTKSEKAAKGDKATKAGKAAKAEKPVPDEAAPVAKASKGRSGAARRRRRKGAAGPEVQAAIDVATVEATTPPQEPQAEGAGGRRRRNKVPPSALNDPLTFVTFVTEHPIGTSVTGTVASFVSHGAMVDVGEMHCYAPLSGLGAPPPHRAREVLELGEARDFVLVGLDPPRRGAELALPEVARFVRNR